MSWWVICIYFSRTILHNKLKIWNKQPRQNKSSPQKYFMLIHLWFYFLIFFWCGNLKFWLSAFCQTNLMKENMYYFLKNGSNKNVSNFVVYIIKFIWFNHGDTVLYLGLSLGTPVLCKGLIYLYKSNTLWYI